MATLSISISVNTETGSMTVDPSMGYSSPGDTLAWQATNGTSVTISFKDQSPFNTFQLRSQTNSLNAAMASNVARGIYHYVVSVLANDGKIYTIPGCPEIIVQ